MVLSSERSETRGEFSIGGGELTKGTPLMLNLKLSTDTTDSSVAGQQPTVELILMNNRGHRGQSIQFSGM